MMMETLALLGTRCTDKVSGYTGVALSLCIYHDGKSMVLVEGSSPHTEESRQRWIDADRLQWLDERVIPSVWMPPAPPTVAVKLFDA